MRDGFRGVELGSNINGAALGDPKFDVFFAAAEELGAAIFVHALHPSGKERIVGPPGLMAYIGFPLDTAYCIASLMTGGTLTRYPKPAPRLQPRRRRLRLDPAAAGARLGHQAGIRRAHRRVAVRACAQALLRHAGLRPAYAAPSDRYLRRAPALHRHRLPVRHPRPHAGRGRSPRCTLSDGDLKLLHHDNAMRFLGDPT